MLRRAPPSAVQHRWDSADLSQDPDDPPVYYAVTAFDYAAAAQCSFTAIRHGRATNAPWTWVSAHPSTQRRGAHAARRKPGGSIELHEFSGRPQCDALLELCFPTLSKEAGPRSPHPQLRRPQRQPQLEVDVCQGEFVGLLPGLDPEGVPAGPQCPPQCVCCPPGGRFFKSSQREEADARLGGRMAAKRAQGVAQRRPPAADPRG